MTSARTYLELGRPFTLVAPALGFLSGGLTALGAAPPEPLSMASLTYPLIGSLMAAVLNAGNNALNQIYDLEIDRINKPKRPLPSGRVSTSDAWVFAAVTYLLALVLAWLVAPGGRHECFWIVLVAVICTFIYSMPPLRTKRLGIWANITIAIPRGVLLKVAGWSSVKTIVGIEPWYIGAIFGLFLLGATTTKDFADMEGDRLGGCRTLPIQYRRPPGGLDDLAVVRDPVRDDQHRIRPRDPHGQFHPAPGTRPVHDDLWSLRLLPHASPARGAGGRGKPRVVGPHVSNDVRRTNRIRSGVSGLAWGAAGSA